MVHFFPYLEECIHSGKAPGDICESLRAVTVSGRAAFFSNAEFIGQASPSDFRLIPRLGYRNSFLPVLTGNITEAGGETVIAVTARLHIWTRVLLILWFGMAGYFFLCGMIGVLMGGLEKIILILAAVGFMIIGQLLMRCCFYSPARKALKRLEELLR